MGDIHVANIPRETMDDLRVANVLSNSESHINGCVKSDHVQELLEEVC